MQHNQNKSAGLSLIFGCFLMIITMALHPVGGDFHHLVQIATIGTIVHMVALLSLPFVTYGFWGVTEQIYLSFLARLSFIFLVFGLIAVMIAAALNGLILMGFVRSYEGYPEETIAALKPFFRFIQSFNQAFDFIFIGAICVSTLLYSLAMFWHKRGSLWLGFFGLSIVAIALALLVSGFVFVNLHGFRLFVFGWVIWVAWLGVAILKPFKPRLT